MGKVSELVKDLNKHFGKDVLGYASDERYRITRISTGSLTLDKVTGGGIAKGRFTELFGPYSALKTYTALRTIAIAQKQGERTLYCDAERSFDPAWAERLGVDIGKLRIYVPDFGEELIDVVEAVLRSGEYGLVVVDSIAALIPKSEIEESASKEQMGLMGRLTSKMMRRLNAANSSATAVILVNQLREKIGVMWGKPETTTGGRAIPFYAGQRLEFRPGERIKKNVDGKDVAVGRMVSITVEKDKTGPNVGRVGQVAFINREGIDTVEELITLGEAEGLVTRSGQTYNYRDISAVGRVRFKKALQKDRKTRKRLKKEIMNGQTEMDGEEAEA